jgi:XRE family aerobic/anaerobic benzoate catabolism transcriptional regulator
MSRPTEPRSPAGAAASSARAQAAGAEVDTANEAADRYLVEVGTRIRRLRTERRLSRRVLGERAGLSQRFIAHLEAGSGNISLKRLKRLADALDTDLAEIVAIAPAGSAVRALADRLAGAPAGVRAEVARLLDGLDCEAADRISARRIALVGLRGAGKSTLGRLAAKRLGLAFVELNSEISRSAGLGIAEIFALYGEEGYRRHERAELTRIARRGTVVLAVAGGIVDHHESYEFLKRNFLCVWLRASPEEHMARVIAQGDRRPMAGNPDAMADLCRILRTREAAYAEADASLDTAGRELDVSAAELAALIERLTR